MSTALHFHVECRDVKASRPMLLQAKLFGIGLGLVVSGLGFGLGLMHCGAASASKKFSASASISLASALASCRAGLVNIPGRMP